jgi:hypothetical protein
MGMNNAPLKLLGLVAAAAVMVPSAASAAGTGQGTFNLHATVPVACWVQTQRGDGLIDAAQPVGEVVEACNSARGYQVTAAYRPLGSGERATLRYAERVIRLPANGDAMLRRASIAQIRTVSYAFEDVQLQAPLVLALSIQPF